MSIRYIHTIIWNLNIKIFPIFNYLKLWSSQSVQNRLDGLYDTYKNNEEMEMYIPYIKYKPIQNYKFKTHATIINNDINYGSADGKNLSMFTFKTNFMLLTPFRSRMDSHPINTVEYTFKYRL